MVVNSQSKSKNFVVKESLEAGNIILEYCESMVADLRLIQ
jgi:hypothetical protein